MEIGLKSGEELLTLPTPGIKFKKICSPVSNVDVGKITNLRENT